MSRVGVGGKGCVVGLMAATAGNRTYSAPNRRCRRPGMTVGSRTCSYTGAGSGKTAEVYINSFVGVECIPCSGIDRGIVGYRIGMTELAPVTIRSHGVDGVAISCRIGGMAATAVRRVAPHRGSNENVAGALDSVTVAVGGGAGAHLASGGLTR